MGDSQNGSGRPMLEKSGQVDTSSLIGEEIKSDRKCEGINNSVVKYEE